jgi:AcrR family transcriptional regulator
MLEKDSGGKQIEKQVAARPGTRAGRPRGDAAVSHAAILDAVYELLREKPVSAFSMEAVAKRAGVGKPTLYKWWPSKAALIMAMFSERLDGKLETLQTATVEEAIRVRVRNLIREFNGLFGKVMADLIAEGQSDPAVLRELYERHFRVRRAGGVALMEQGKASGEFAADVQPELLVDAIFGALYYRRLLGFAPMTEEYGESLVDQVLRGAKAPFS